MRLGSSHWRQDRPWFLAVLAIAVLAGAPVAAIAFLALGAEAGVWSHLAATVLPAALVDTAMLLSGVAVLAGSIGVVTAWLVAAHDFPGRRLFEGALLLPLAMPAYIVAYTYVDLTDYFGPVQSVLRFAFGFRSRQDYWFPDLRSMPGAICLLGLVLYPYVYLTARAMFMMQSSCVIDAARTLGAGPRAAFFQIALPLARPAIAVGVALALMEAMNDIGAVEYLGVRTLTVSIYTTWLNRGSLAGAAQIALLTLAVIIGLIVLERWARRNQRYASQAQRQRRMTRLRLTGGGASLAVLACAVPFALGFAVPALRLAVLAVRATLAEGLPDGFAAALSHSVTLATIAATLAVAFGLTIAWSLRVTRTPGLHGLARLAGLGYAIPGTIFAVGMLTPLAAVDNAVNTLAKAWFGLAPGLILSGSGFALVLAYSVRYLSVAAGSIEAGFQKISPHLDMAARNLGRTSLQTVREIHVPLIRPALGTAALLVFVDVMKELSATLLLRPFDYDTLATLLYQQAARGLFENGALAALTIVAAGLGPVLLLAHLSRPADMPSRSRASAGAML